MKRNVKKAKQHTTYPMTEYLEKRLQSPDIDDYTKNMFKDMLEKLNRQKEVANNG